MKHYYKFYITDLILGILFSIFFISLSTILTINFRYLYYMDINFLNIVSDSGFTKETILENYNALIHWCSPFVTGSLVLPTFPQSKEAIIHFDEVKSIFNMLYIIVGSLTPAFLALIIWKKKHKNPHYLLTTSISLLVVPLIVGIFCMVDFDAFFTLFHSIFFKNDFWIFDPNTDPIILILPEAYFMHCALLIIFIQILVSFIFFCLYRKMFKRNSSFTSK